MTQPIDLTPEAEVATWKRVLAVFEHHAYGHPSTRLRDDLVALIIERDNLNASRIAGLEAEVERLRTPLEQISRMTAFPDDKINRTALVVAREIAKAALIAQPTKDNANAE